MASRGDKFAQIMSVIDDVCQKWSVPIVDMFNEGNLNTKLDSHRLKYSNNGDATHPNQLGYEIFYLPMIEAKIKSI